MASADLLILNEYLYGKVSFQVEDRDTSTNVARINPGEILNKFGSGTGTTAAVSGNLANLCIDPGANGIGIDAADQMLGIAFKESTEAAAVSGRVTLHLFGYGTRFRGRATTAGNMNTVAELNGLELDHVTIDGITTKSGNAVTTPYTIDENDTDDPNVHAFQILTGDIVDGTLEVRVVAGIHGVFNGI